MYSPSDAGPFFTSLATGLLNEHAFFFPSPVPVLMIPRADIFLFVNYLLFSNNKILRERDGWMDFLQRTSPPFAFTDLAE